MQVFWITLFAWLFSADASAIWEPTLPELPLEHYLLIDPAYDQIIAEKNARTPLCSSLLQSSEHKTKCHPSLHEASRLFFRLPRPKQDRQLISQTTESSKLLSAAWWIQGREQPLLLFMIGLKKPQLEPWVMDFITHYLTRTHRLISWQDHFDLPSHWPIKQGSKRNIAIVAPKISMLYLPLAHPDWHITCSQTKEQAPIKKDEVLGSMNIFLGSRQLASLPILADENISARSSLWPF